MAITKDEYKEAKERALELFDKAGVYLTEKEKDEIEVADFGLGRLDEFGVQLITYTNTERVSAKDVAIFPGQICPEHYHPDIGGNPGKEETFRCRYGEMYLYVPGDAAKEPRAAVPEDKKDTFHVWHEIVLKKGEQHLVAPGTPHWFQAGPEGAVFAEFSTKNVDEADVFSDREIKRMPEILE